MPGFNAQLPSDRADQFTDPFLVSLLNHITLPPQVPQSVSSPNDLYMSNLGWSPQASLSGGQHFNSAQYNLPTSYAEPSYLNQPQHMGMNPAQPDNRSTNMNNAGVSGNATRNPDDAWIGYFGSG